MSIEYKVYFRKFGESTWDHLGDTSDTQWDLSDLSLDYYTIYEWRVDTYDTETELTTTGNTWIFITTYEGSGFPYDRKSDYEAGEVWDPDTETWVDPSNFGSITVSPGKLKAQMIAVANGKIYVEEY